MVFVVMVDLSLIMMIMVMISEILGFILDLEDVKFVRELWLG